jgi:4-hydroxy-3-polyprenylbenzoate decarboxylase
MFPSLRALLDALERAGELHRVACPVSPVLEVSEIADRVARMRAPRASTGARAFDPAMAGMGGPALLFERVQGCDFPLAMNVFGSYARMEMALGCGADPRGLGAPADRIGGLVRVAPPRTLGEALAKARELAPLLRIGPRRVRRGACQEVVRLTARGEVDLARLPIVKCWPLDGDPSAVGFPLDAAAAGTAGGGGRYITLAGMHTVHADDRDAERPASHNIGMYRSQLLGPTRLAMHWHMHHDGAAHWRSWKRLGKPMPIAICLGGESVLAYGATAPLPPGISELLMCGFLNGRGIPMVRARTVPLWVPANAEIVIEGWVSTECGGVGWEPRRDSRAEIGGADGSGMSGRSGVSDGPGTSGVSGGEPLGPGAVFEGPFGDHTGFYSLPDRYPIVEVTALTHRKDAIYPATIVGLPPQEDYYLGKATERIFLPLLRTLIHDVEDYHLPQFGCFHNAAFVAIRKAYPLQGRRVMSSVWGAGQMAWTKLVFVLDHDAPLHDEEAAVRAIFRRCNFLRDTVTVQGPLDILDHAAPWLGAGAKMGFDCTTRMEGEAWNGVPLGDPRLPSDAEVAACGRAIAEACRAAGVAATCAFPGAGLGRLCAVQVSNEEPDAGPRAVGAALAALEADRTGAADLLVVVDGTCDPEEWTSVLFHLASNADPARDTWRAHARLAFDATRKAAGTVRGGLPTRRFPPVVRMDPATRALVDRRWGEYGFTEPPPRVRSIAR